MMYAQHDEDDDDDDEEEEGDDGGAVVNGKDQSDAQLEGEEADD
jgi:hypothetical protein